VASVPLSLKREEKSTEEPRRRGEEEGADDLPKFVMIS